MMGEQKQKVTDFSDREMFIHSIIISGVVVLAALLGLKANAMFAFIQFVCLLFILFVLIEIKWSLAK